MKASPVIPKFGVWAIGWVVDSLPEMVVTGSNSCDREDKASKWVSVAALCIQMGASRKLWNEELKEAQGCKQS